MITLGRPKNQAKVSLTLRYDSNVSKALSANISNVHNMVVALYTLASF